MRRLCQESLLCAPARDNRRPESGIVAASSASLQETIFLGFLITFWQGGLLTPKQATERETVLLVVPIITASAKNRLLRLITGCFG